MEYPILGQDHLFPEMPMGDTESENKERQGGTLFLAVALLSNLSVELQ